MHRPGRMAFGDVERGEIVPVVFDLRTGRDGKAQVSENLCQFVHHLADRVDCPARGFKGGQRKVDRLACQLRFKRSRFQGRLAGAERLGHAFAQCVDLRSGFLALFGGHCPEGL